MSATESSPGSHRAGPGSNRSADLRRRRRTAAHRAVEDDERQATAVAGVGDPVGDEAGIGGCRMGREIGAAEDMRRDRVEGRRRARQRGPAGGNVRTSAAAASSTPCLRPAHRSDLSSDGCCAATAAPSLAIGTPARRPMTWRHQFRSAFGWRSADGAAAECRSTSTAWSAAWSTTCCCRSSPAWSRGVRARARGRVHGRVGGPGCRVARRLPA